MKNYSSIILRYLILLIVAVPNLFLFYFIFTPLTVYPVYFLLNLVFNASLVQNTILLGQEYAIEIISACVAGSAYYLLLILNLSTPDIPIKKRLNMIFLSFLSLLILNILRIFILVLVLMILPNMFDVTHKLFWYFISILFVVGIWFTEVKYFRIKTTPVYSDIKFLIKNIKKSKNSKKNKKSR